MSEELFKIFDSWEPLLKARKAKGLHAWTKLQPIAEKLKGKGVSNISFTCCHPSHANEPVKHLLGSVEGNLHFLMGYGNPQFHFSAYQLSIIDPNVTLEEAEEMFSKMKHPSNPAIWAKAGIQAGPEGDLEEGSPSTAKVEVKAKSKVSQTVKAKSPTGTFTCSPEEGLITNDTTGHVYRWDLVKDSFFSYFNPEAAEAMNNAAVQKSINTVLFKASVPVEVLNKAKAYKGEDFDINTWSLIKSKGKKPGTVLFLETLSGEPIYGIITPSTIDLFEKSGNSASITIFDRIYSSLDITKEGNVPPASILNFVTKSFHINEELLNEVLEK